MIYFYKVFGLIIQSEIAMSALRAIEYNDTPHVVVKEDTLARPTSTPSGTIHQKYLVYHPTFCFQELELNGAFQIHYGKDGAEVILDFRKTSDPQTLLSFFYGTGLAVILQMQGKFPLHASGVLMNKKLKLFCGPSGIGKSTLTAYLKTQGHTIFTDDKCLLFYDKITAQWKAHPSLQIMRLWKDATASMSTASFLKNPVPVLYNDDKYQYQILASEQVVHDAPLSSIYILATDEALKAPTCRLIQGIDKMKHLQEQVFRREMVQGFDQELALWRFISQLAKDTTVYLITRPTSLPIVDMGAFVEEICSKH